MRNSEFSGKSWKKEFEHCLSPQTETLVVNSIPWKECVRAHNSSVLWKSLFLTIADCMEESIVVGGRQKCPFIRMIHLYTWDKPIYILFWILQDANAANPLGLESLYENMDTPCQPGNLYVHVEDYRDLRYISPTIQLWDTLPNLHLASDPTQYWPFPVNCSIMFTPASCPVFVILYELQHNVNDLCSVNRL